MLFTLAVDQSAAPLPSVTPTAQIHVSKCSWFPSLSSCWRRNFLEKRFAFLATRELLLQLKLGCFALSSAPRSVLLLTNNLLAGMGGRWATRLELWMAHLVEILLGCPSFTVGRLCWVLVLNSSQREERFVSPWLDLRMWERPDTCVGGNWGVSVSEELQLPDLTNEARKLSFDTGRILSE